MDTHSDKTLDPNPSTSVPETQDESGVVKFPLAIEGENPIGNFTILEIQNKVFGNKIPSTSMVFFQGKWIAATLFLKENKNLIYKTTNIVQTQNNKITKEQKSTIRKSNLWKPLVGIPLAAIGIVSMISPRANYVYLIFCIAGISLTAIGLRQIISPQKPNNGK